MATYAVLGAGGGTGKACVETLLSQACEGVRVRAVVRDPEKPSVKALAALASSASTQLEIVRGDVTDAESLRQALDGCTGCIFAASAGKEVDCQGVKNVADVVKELGGRQRVVLVSSALVTPPRRFHPIRLMLNNLVSRGLMDAKWQGEEHLRKSGVPYTIVRPGRLTDQPGGEAQLVAEQGDRSTGQVSRADVAAVCVAALTDPAANGVTFELMSVKRKEGGLPLAEQIKGIFQGLKPDS